MGLDPDPDSQSPTHASSVDGAFLTPRVAISPRSRRARKNRVPCASLIAREKRGGQPNTPYWS